MKSFKAAAGLGLLLLTFPATALAHTAAATVSCTGAQFSFQRFSPGSNTVNYKVTVDNDNNVAAHGTFKLNEAGGSAGHLAVPLTIYGTHVVRAFAWWGPTGTQTGETRPANSPALATEQVHCAAAPLAAAPAPTPAAPAAVAAPVAAAPAPAPPAPPAIGVLSETARSAPAVRLSVQPGCAARHVRVTVSGRLMSQVRISVSGRHARTVTVKPNARSVTTLVALRRNGPAVQTVTTRITFRNGANARRLISPARRCSQVAVAPKFTG
jgi:hypothetical protein